MSIRAEVTHTLPIVEEERITTVDFSNASTTSYFAVQEKAASAAGKASVQLPASKGIMVMGIVQGPGDPSSVIGGPVRVGRIGFSRAVAGATFNSGVELMAETDGKLVAATTGLWVVGISREAASQIGAVVSIFMNGGYYKA